jgi:hypothetical protein
MNPAFVELEGGWVPNKNIAPETPQWSYSMVELVEWSKKKPEQSSPKQALRVL